MLDKRSISTMYQRLFNGILIAKTIMHKQHSLDLFWLIYFSGLNVHSIVGSVAFFRLLSNTG